MPTPAPKPSAATSPAGFESKKAARTARTHQIQDGHLRRYIAPKLGERRLQKLTPAALRLLFDHLNACGLGASSQRQLHQFLLTALGKAFQLELVTRNVAELIRPNPPKRREESELAAFTPEEAALFLAAAHTDHRDEGFVFALSTGMRRGKLCGLQ